MITRFDVPTLACAHCAGAVTAILMDIPGVTRATANLEQRRVEVECKDRIAQETLLMAIREVGYEAAPTVDATV